MALGEMWITVCWFLEMLSKSRATGSYPVIFSYFKVSYMVVVFSGQSELTSTGDLTSAYRYL